MQTFLNMWLTTTSGLQTKCIKKGLVFPTSSQYHLILVTHIDEVCPKKTLLQQLVYLFIYVYIPKMFRTYICCKCVNFPYLAQLPTIGCI